MAKKFNFTVYEVSGNKLIVIGSFVHLSDAEIFRGHLKDLFVCKRYIILKR